MISAAPEAERYEQTMFSVGGMKHLLISCKNCCRRGRTPTFEWRNSAPASLVPEVGPGIVWPSVCAGHRRRIVNTVQCVPSLPME
jgi:hypothetical protein